MEDTTYLIIPFAEFKEKTEELLAKADSLLGEKVVDSGQLTSFEEEIKKWDSEVAELLRTSFSKEKNSYAHDFKYANSNKYIIPGNGNSFQQPIHKIVDDRKSDLRQKRLQLHVVMVGRFSSDFFVFICAKNNFTIT